MNLDVIEMLTLSMSLTTSSKTVPASTITISTCLISTIKTKSLSITYSSLPLLNRIILMRAVVNKRNRMLTVKRVMVPTKRRKEVIR
jgi:hypothetical protein